MKAGFQSQRSSGRFLRWATRDIPSDDQEAPLRYTANAPHFADRYSLEERATCSDDATLTPAESRRIIL